MKFNLQFAYKTFCYYIMRWESAYVRLPMEDYDIEKERIIKMTSIHLH